MSTTPIADYALLSDRHSAALVSRGGSIDWLCFPRFDSPSIFGRLLGEEAGHWTIGTAEPAAGDSALPGSHHGVGDHPPARPRGAVTIADALAMGAGNRGHELGKGAPHLLVRRVTCTEGQVELSLEYVPRPEYGLVRPLLACGRRWSERVCGRRRVGSLVARGPDRRRSSIKVSGRFQLSHGETRGLRPASPEAGRRRRHPGSGASPRSSARFEDTVAAWESWSELHQAYVGPWRDLVHHSGRVLQSLSFSPTGAICAAATTSLPEAVGGARNWDYRYAWVRDASFTIQALWVAACPDEANEFFDYVTVLGGRLARRGRRPADHVRHRRRTGPDRAGTAAPGGLAALGAGSRRQRRLEPTPARRLRRIARTPCTACPTTSLTTPRRVGPLVGPDKWDAPPDLAPATRRFLVELADTAARRWQEKDQGIWEIRGEPRHFFYSKLMCWVALDRAVALADRLDAATGSRPGSRPRTQIREAILTKGWSDRVNAFTQSFGSDELDASSLMLPLVGFLPADDPRVLATINATEERLTDERGSCTATGPTTGSTARKARFFSAPSG